jgi:hypothetical protein
MTETPFIPGRELSRLFYQEAVMPILDETFPELRYAAALIGAGSEVLGFDTEMSSDHHWGPRVQLFLGEDDLAVFGPIIRLTLAHMLPTAFRGYSTNFSLPDPEDNGTQRLEEISEGPVNHRVELFTLRAYCLDYLGIEHDAEFSPAIWLTMPGQKLLTITAGAIFRDDSNELATLQDRLAYYPHDIWLAMLAAGWSRVGQEEAFMGRTGVVGDELGSRLIAGRLVHDLMNLCFLMDRQYPPFSKWFGAAFQELSCAGRLTPLFQAVFDARSWQEREGPLVEAYEIVAGKHNELAITESLPDRTALFHGRPFRVIHGDKFATAIKAQIVDADVKRITTMTDIGAVEQFSSSTDLLSDTRICSKLRAVYL